MFTNHICDTELISGTYEELSRLNIMKIINNTIKSGQKILKDILMTIIYECQIKSCSIS